MTEQTFDLQPDSAPAPPAAAPDEPQFDLRPETQFDIQPETQAAPVTQPNSLTALQGTRFGISGDQAAQALSRSKRTGLAPQVVAAALPEAQAQQEQSGFEDGLGAAPITAAWAGQSAVHAAAVKPDIGFFEALEQGLVDVGYQELATLQMTYPTEAVEQTLQGYEAEAPEYEARPSPWYADLARNVPQIATYMLSGVLGKMVGGKAGEVGATAGTMFLLNRGSLYRQIIHQMPIPASDEDPRSVGWRGVADYEQKARIYATAGAGASAVLGAGLSSAIGWMVPGAGKRVSDLSTGIIARAFTDAATRDVIGRLVGMGGHTLSGALQMAIPAVIDDATVQAAVRGSVDPGKAAVAGWQAFKTSILAAGALSVVPGLPGLVRDVGRIKMAEPEAGRLQHLVDQAQSAKLIKQAPEDAKELLGKMAVASDAPTVHVATNALAQNPAATQALVESLADGGQSLAEARATGSDVPVPIEKYLVDLGKHHAALRDDVKLDPEGMTPREAREAREAPATMRQNLFEASFKHKETGEVVETGRFHDIAQLPGGENADLDKWEAGFNDAQGKFLTREEAKASLPPELQAYTSPAGLESEDLTPMLRRETTRQREMVDRALRPAETLPSLMAQRDHVLQTEPDTPERAAKLSGIQDRMRSAAARGAGPEGGAGLGRIATPEEVAAASLEPSAAVPPAEVSAVPASPEAPAVPAPEWDAIAERAIEAKTIGELQPGRYERAAETATRKALAAHGKAAEALAAAEQTAQAGIEAGLGGIKAGQRGIKEYKYIREAEWAKELRSAVETADLGEINKTINDLIKRAQNDPNEALGQNQIDVLKNIKKTANAGRKWLEGLRTGTELSPETAAGGLYDVSGTQATGEPPQPGTPEFIAAQEHNIKFGEQEMRRASREAEKARKEAEAQSVRATKATVRAGELAAEAKAHEQARDLSRALAKKAGMVRAEMDGLQDKLVRGYTDDARAKLNLADPAYLGVTDLLMGAVGLAPEVAGPQYGVADAVARMSSDARLLGFDAQAVAELAADPKAWSELTPAEARNLSDALASIRSAAKAETEIALVDRKQNLRAFVGDVRQHFDDIGAPDKGPPPPSRAGLGAFEGAKKKGAAVLAEMLRPETILRRLGAPGEAIMDAFSEARNKKEDLARDVGGVVYKAYERDMPKELKKTRIDSVNGLPTDVVAAGKWVRQDLWTLAGWYGSESGADRLRSGLRVSDQDILTTLSQLTKPEAEFIDKTHALNDEKLWPLVRDHEIATTGTSAPKVEARPFTVTLADGTEHTFRGGYWPGKSQGTTAPPSEDTIAGYWGTLRNDIPATSKGFTKERTVRTSYIPDLNWSAYSSHVNSVLHYLAYDDFVRNAGRVFKDPEFRSLVERRLGTQEMAEMDKFATVSARGSVEGPTGGSDWWNRVVMGGFRSRVATGAFQLNLPVVIGQLSHLPAAMFGMRISPIDMLQGVGKAFSPESWAEDHGESKQLPYRWNGYGTHMRELFADVGPEARVGWRKWIDAGGWSLYHAMDGFLSKSIYGAAKAQALRGGALAEEAAAAGDKAVSMMMPPLNLAEQSSLARDRGVIGSLMLVRNFPNTLYNVGAMNAWQARTGIWSAAPGWQRATRVAGGSAAAAGAYLGMVLSAHIFGRFLMGHGRQEDETTPDWLERESLAAPFYPIPFASEVVTPIAESAVSGKSLKQTMAFGHADIRAAPAIAMLQDSIRDMGRIMDEGSETPDRIQAAARLAGMALRLPVYPLKPLRYGFDVATGNVQPRGGLDLGAGFVYGQRPRQTRNPLTAGQDIASGEWQ